MMTKPIITYSPWILSLVLHNEKVESQCIIKSANATARGVEAVIIDKVDNQKYRLSIEPLYEYEPGGQRPPLDAGS